MKIGIGKRGAIWSLGISALMLAALFALLAGGYANGFIRFYAENAASELLGMPCQIGAIEGNPLRKYQVQDITLGDVGHIDTVRVTYSLGDMVWGRVVIDSLVVSGANVRAPAQTEDATDRTAWSDLHFPVALGAHFIGVRRSAVRVGTHQIRDIDLDGQFEADARQAHVTLVRSHSVFFDPPLTISDFSGVALLANGDLALRDLRIQTPNSDVRLSGNIRDLDAPVFDLALMADSLAFGDLLAFGVPGLPSKRARGTVHVQGSSSGAHADIDVKADGVSITGQIDGAPERVQATWSLRVTARDFDPGAWMADFDRDLVLDLDVASTGGFSEGAVDSLRLDGRFAHVQYAGARWDSARAHMDLVNDALKGDLTGAGPSGNLALTWDGQLRDSAAVGNLTASFSRFDLSAIPDVPQGVGRITGRVGVRRDSVWEGEMHLDRAVVSEQTFAGIDLSVRGDGARFEFDRLGVSLPQGWGRLDGRGRLDLWGALPAFALDLDGQLALDALTDTTLWGREIALAIAVEGGGSDLSSLELSGDIHGQISEFPVGLDSLRAAVKWSGMHLTESRVALWGEDGKIQISGSAGWPGDLGLAFEADLARIRAIGSLVGTPVDGTPLRVAGTVTGTSDRPEIAAQFSSDSIAVSEVPISEVSGRLRWVVPDSGGIAVRARRISWGDRELDGLFADASYGRGETSFLVGSRADAHNRLFAWGKVSETRDGFQMGLDSLLVQADQVAFFNEGPCQLAFSRLSGLQIGRFQLRGPGGRIVAQNHPNAQATVEVFLQNMDLRPWAFLFDMPHIKGVLNGEFVISGALSEPLVFAELSLRDGRYRGIRIRDAQASASYGQGRVLAEITLQPMTGLPVELQGSFPIRDLGDDENEIHLAAQSRGFALSTLDTLLVDVGKIEGVASFDVSAKGTFADPTLEGHFQLADGRIGLVALNRTFEDVRGSLRLEADRLVLDSLKVGKAHSGYFAGTVELVRFQPAEWRLQAKMRDLFVVDLPDLRVRTDADLVVSGTPQNPRLEGKVALRQADIRLAEMLTAPGSIWESSPFLQALTMRVQVLADRQIWVRDPDLQVEITGDVDVFRERDVFRVYGSMSTRRGFYTFQNRRLRIDQGEILFQGRDDVNPDLDIRTETQQRLPGSTDPVRIFVNVGGTLTHPEVTVSSEPPYEQADILALLTTGRTVESFDRAGDRNQEIFGAVRDQAVNMMVGVAAQHLLLGVGQEWNLDLVEVDLGASNVSRIRVGKYFGPRLFVSYAQEISGTGRELAMEFEIVRRLTLEGRHVEDVEEETKNPRTRTSIGLFWRRDW